MGRTVYELQSQMSSLEFSEWLAFYEIEPFGWEAYFVGHAQTAAVIYNVNRGKDGKPLETKDFMPREPEIQTADQMLQFAAMMTAALGGEIGGTE